MEAATRIPRLRSTDLVPKERSAADCCTCPQARPSKAGDEGDSDLDVLVLALPLKPSLAGAKTKSSSGVEASICE